MLAFATAASTVSRSSLFDLSSESPSSMGRMAISKDEVESAANTARWLGLGLGLGLG